MFPFFFSTEAGTTDFETEELCFLLHVLMFILSDVRLVFLQLG